MDSPVFVVCFTIIEISHLVGNNLCVNVHLYIFFFFTPSPLSVENLGTTVCKKHAR